VITASLPTVLDPDRVNELLPAGVPVRLVRWDLVGDPETVAPQDLDVVVLPFHSTAATPHPPYVGTELLARALPQARRAGLVQLLSIGYEGVGEHLPTGARLANAAGVMERQTAELACALLLAGMRDLIGFHTARPQWANHRTRGLVGSRVLLLGHGGIGTQIDRRLAGFDVDLTLVAARARTLPDGRTVHGVEELAALARDADALVCSVPLTPHTRGLIGSEVLAALPDGALVVNVGRGPVIDTEALLKETSCGRLRAALDVTDPEPLPPQHPLWSVPGVLITPHVGGNTELMGVLLHELVAAQLTRLHRGEPLRNIVREAGA